MHSGNYRRKMLSRETAKSSMKIPYPASLLRFRRVYWFKLVITVVTCLLLLELVNLMVSSEGQWKTLIFGPSAIRVRVCDGNGCRDVEESEFDEINMKMNATNNATSTYFSSIHGSIVNLTVIHPYFCPAIPPGLIGHVNVQMNHSNEQDTIQVNTEVQPGGRFQPKDCAARHTVAIVIPYRNRAEHLSIFLHNIHPILRRQQLDYGIFVVEQNGNTTFNRAALMNVGYVEAKKSHPYHCFIFHDVDLLPENDRNLYSCPDAPRHMSTAIDKFRYKLPYSRSFGGVSALTDFQIEKINGFPNAYWGWGGEDDDIAERVKINGYDVSRYGDERGRYKMIKHESDSLNPVNPRRFDLIYTEEERFQTDGLSNLKYKILDMQLRPLYTWLLVDVGTPSTAPSDLATINLQLQRHLVVCSVIYAYHWILRMEII